MYPSGRGGSACVALVRLTVLARRLTDPARARRLRLQRLLPRPRLRLRPLVHAVRCGEKQIGGSGVHFPGPLPMHRHAVYMAYSECLTTLLSPLRGYVSPRRQDNADQRRKATKASPSPSQLRRRPVRQGVRQRLRVTGGDHNHLHHHNNITHVAAITCPTIQRTERVHTTMVTRLSIQISSDYKPHDTRHLTTQ